jgi:ferric-dicitrate binding protein FerR (iron transport regulator)
LPDDSEVVLNADSKITYNKKNWDDTRELSLDGEAYFKVTKGNKFSVKTVEGTVSVLGTQFNVFARNGFLTVACYEGLVSVSFNDKEIKVPAGSKIQIENGNLVMNHTNEIPSPVWLSNESNFESAPLSLVLKELERQFPIKVTVGKVVPDHRFSGTFTHTSLELALQAICGPLHLNYEINKNGTVFINAKNSE